MKKYLLKIVCVVLLLAVIVSLVTCSNKVITADFSDLNGPDTGTANNVQNPVTLTFWHLWSTDSEKNKSVFDENLKAFEEANTDIKIEVDAIENEAYKTKLNIAIAANEAPDLFYSWGAGFSKPYIEAGKVLALDDYIADGIKGRIIGGALDNFTYDGKLYGLPISSLAGIFFCNKEVFEQNRIKIPDTFSELLNAVKVFRLKNITPIAVGEKDGWPGMFIQNILAIRTAGVGLCTDALNKKASFDRQEFIDSAEKLSTLVKAGAFDKKCMEMTRDEAQADFKLGSAAMYYNGSWIAGELEAKDDPSVTVAGKIIARNFPIVEDAKGDQNGFLGGAVDCFMVNSNTKYKEQAIRTLKYMAENHSKRGYEAGALLPAWKANIDESKLSPLTREIVKLTKDSTGYVLAWDTFLTPDDSSVHKNLVADIFAGIITPRGFAEEMQKLNEKQKE